MGDLRIIKKRKKGLPHVCQTDRTLLVALVLFFYLQYLPGQRKKFSINNI